MKQKTRNWALATTLLASSAIGHVHAAEKAYWTLGTGMDYSTGKYGSTSTTESLSIPFFAQYGTNIWSLGLTVPYLQVTGDGTVIVSGRQTGRRTTTASTSKRTTQSGLGDVLATASRNLVAADVADIGIDLAGRIKFGTASKNMGSGLNDYAVQVSAFSYYGNFSPRIMLGYEVLGDTPDLPLNNVAYGAVSSSYFISDSTSAGMEYKYGQRASATGFEQRELNFYASHRFGTNNFFRLYVMQGFSDGSPDSGFGLSVSTGF